MGSLAESKILLHFELHSRLDHYEWMFLYIYRWSANAHARTLARTPVPKLNHNKILSPWPTAMFVPERLPRKLLKSSEAAVVFNFTALHCIACAFVCVCVCVGCRCWCECMRESEPTAHFVPTMIPDPLVYRFLPTSVRRERDGAIQKTKNTTSVSPGQRSHETSIWLQYCSTYKFVISFSI